MSSWTTRAGASTTRVLVLPKMIKHEYTKNIVLEYYSSTDFPVLVLVCWVLAPALWTTEANFYIKLLSYEYRNNHYGDKTILPLSLFTQWDFLYSSAMESLWIQMGALVTSPIYIIYDGFMQDWNHCQIHCYTSEIWQSCTKPLIWCVMMVTVKSLI